MDKAETEQEEEFSEWVVIQTSPTSPPTVASTPQDSPRSQPSHRREYPPENDDEEDDAVVPVVGEEEGESSSTENLSLPWRVIEISKKRLIKDFFQAVERVRYGEMVETIAGREAEISAPSAQRERSENKGTYGRSWEIERVVSIKTQSSSGSNRVTRRISNKVSKLNFTYTDWLDGSCGGSGVVSGYTAQGGASPWNTLVMRSDSLLLLALL
ncbi:unnamed protein product [Microthlaspi erraticum]|uniref:Uncharacterized protein n=1 Tax=Microthlaspi erraticum TaxID=1685480 RepID=A0A6D2KKG0_9BRAS|nr:unnamed protein product [Microthlaspi erraticum]CAA7049701.1 unnamed protein product [Microthlaspi erraticum]